MPEYIVSTSADRVRVRLGAGLEYPALVALPTGATVNVIKIVDGWAQVEVKMGDIIPIMDDDVHVPAMGYMLARLLKPATVTPPPPPPPITTGKYNRLGVNVINYHRGAEDAIRLGCKALVIMDNEDLARDIKRAYPDVFVMFRRYIGTAPLDGAGLIQKLGWLYPEIDCYQLYNEADSGFAGSYGTQLQMQTRIRNELYAADHILSRGCGVALGSYSMGCFDFNAPWAVELGKLYAPYYNDPNKRVYFDMHSYSPAMGRFFQQPTSVMPMTARQMMYGNVGRNLLTLASWEQDYQRGFTGSPSPLQNKPMDDWFEGRWRRMFTQCKFNPSIRRIIASETGVDEGGVGGFPAHNANTQDFAHWATNWLAYQASPLVVAGQSYDSPFLAGMIYQYGGGTNQSWQGYDVTAYLAELKRVAW